MNKKEFVKKMSELNLVKKNYKSKEFKKFEYYVDKVRFFIVGYYMNKNNKYIIFFKDFEREAFKEIGEFEQEEEVYEPLIELIEEK